jgi:hypothetical protein
MTLKFRGDYARIKKYVFRTGFDGQWRDLQNGGRQYRTDDGGVLNWWKRSGKILFQGHGSAAPEFKQAFIAVASAKGRLTDEDGKSPRDLQGENVTLRALIADVLVENARLKKCLLKG